MAHVLPESKEQISSGKLLTGEELATRLFSLIMLGICALILLMAAFGGW